MSKICSVLFKQEQKANITQFMEFWDRLGPTKNYHSKILSNNWLKITRYIPALL